MTARTFDPQVCDRPIKLLGLLGSKHDGERAAAGLKANELLRRCGLQWSDVIIAPGLVPPSEPPPDDLDDEDAVDWSAVIEFCWARCQRLNEKEFGFVDSMRSWDGEPTERGSANGCATSRDG